MSGYQKRRSSTSTSNNHRRRLTLEELEKRDDGDDCKMTRRTYSTTSSKPSLVHAQQINPCPRYPQNKIHLPQNPGSRRRSSLSSSHRRQRLQELEEQQCSKYSAVVPVAAAPVSHHHSHPTHVPQAHAIAVDVNCVYPYEKESFYEDESEEDALGVIEVQPIAVEVLKDSVDPPGHYQIDNHSIVPEDAASIYNPGNYNHHHKKSNISLSSHKENDGSIVLMPNAKRNIRKHELENMKRLLSTTPSQAGDEKPSLSKQRSFRSTASSSSTSGELIDLYRDPQNPNHMIEIYIDRQGRRRTRIHKPRHLNFFQKLGFHQNSNNNNKDNHKGKDDPMSFSIPEEYANLRIQI